MTLGNFVVLYDSCYRFMWYDFFFVIKKKTKTRSLSKNTPSRQWWWWWSLYRDPCRLWTIEIREDVFVRCSFCLSKSYLYVVMHLSSYDYSLSYYINWYRTLYVGALTKTWRQPCSSHIGRPSILSSRSNIVFSGSDEVQRTLPKTSKSDFLNIPLIIII